MSEPIVYISRWRIKEGRLSDYEALVRKVTPTLEAGKPQTLALLQFVADNQRDLTIIHVFADAAAFEAHVEGSDRRASAAYELIEPVAFEMYGRPTEASWDAFRDILAAGRPFERQPRFLNGFLRLAGSQRTVR
jgi:hypothetical protein